MSDLENANQFIPTKQCYKSWLRQDGTLIEKIYDQKQYNITSYAKSKDKRAEVILCECGHSYKRSNTFNHMKTQKHKLNLQLTIQLSLINKLKL